MKPSKIILLTILITASTLICGCTAGTGTLADYLGWQSLGGNWRGTLDLSDGRDLPFAMTFTEFDGESFHVLVEAGEGAEYINNQADADYTASSRSFVFDLLPFFGGPCHVTGAMVDTYNISGSLQVNQGDSILSGTYAITYTP